MLKLASDLDEFFAARRPEGSLMTPGVVVLGAAIAGIGGAVVLLADEPTESVDRVTGQQLLREFRRVADRNVAVVVVTHDPMVAEAADRSLSLTDGRLQ